MYFQMAKYAQQYGALQVALEHRFYGKSRPFNDLATDNLAYLSSQQALADAAYFIQSFKSMMNADESPVITFGCSYPGSLAAWFRLKYPHVTVASVASSAPVQAELDFYQYLDVVDRSLSFFTGPQCDSLIQLATQQIQQLLQTKAGQTQLAQLFNWCSPISDPRDVPTFMSSLMGVWQGLVQYNDERPGVPDIAFLCNRLVQGGASPLAAYAKLSLQMLVPVGECLDISYANSVAQIANSSYSDDDVGIRQWIYQSCTEFGYFQTTDGDAQPFGDLVPTTYWLDQCKDAFGRPFDTEQLIYDTNVYYGGNNLTSGDGTNVLFVNGNIDPWSSLSVTEDIDGTLKAIFINGTAHCANVMQADPRSSPPALIEAQNKISSQIGEWLSAHTRNMLLRNQ
eukprot:TRINITY_DN1702_c0_g1_i5.p1 TRINITY_DN1702_c0_g1~~TRINITY_DN1702_c0_g1_i5.p1  ORF type:complete len:397 (+),score=42.76 TRINITY_DN1702_c0_g1_i5:382-1572(+)